jgi:hypothetical protein
MQNSDTDSSVAAHSKTLQSTTWLRLAFCLHFAFCILNVGVAVDAQRLIDRVLARVGKNAVTMTDVRAALELGLIETKPGEDPQASALERTIDRQLLLDEVARFSPPEPPPEAVGEEVAAMKSRAGSGLDALVEATGLSEVKLHQLARETVRIRAYIAQRFGASAQVTEDEARKYYDEHPGEFTVNGMLVAFEEVEAEARRRASAERLRVTIDQWIRDLRSRAEVVIVGAGAGAR